MRIATWNIGEDERNDGGKLTFESYDYIIKMIKNENLDIVCLQEAIIKSNHLPSIASYIKENTDLKYILEYELSDSHINIGARMGVVICSKFEIDNYRLLKLDNPNFIYSIDEDTTYYSHDKGFIIARIKEYNLITGHCLPFHVFKKNALDYLNIFKKADEEFINSYCSNKKTILCGDFNYDDVNKLFPKIMENCKDLIDSPTRKEKKFDHFIISDELECTYKNIIDNAFDHKLGIFDIETTIIIAEKDLGVVYPELGKGVEGTVYKYNETQVIKILNREETSLDTIIERVKYLMNIKVENVVFPESLVCNPKNEVIGYSMKAIIPNKYKSFFNLYECKDNEEFINYFMRAQETMKELHKKDIFIGDFNPNNIMIDENNNPIFIDTINYATSEFVFLLEPYNSMIYEKIFKRKCSLLDNDKFMFAFLLLSYFVSFNDLEKAIKNSAYFKEVINNLDISVASKTILNKIFSRNGEKEYIDIVLNDLKQSKLTKYDNKFGKIIRIIFN